MSVTHKVGTVAETWIYPVKGMQGVRVDTISLKSVSVVGDRRIAFSQLDSKQTPTFVDTIKLPSLLHYKPYFVEKDNPKTSEIRVVTPEGRDVGADSEELLKELSDQFKKPLAVVRMGRGAYHSMPVSLISKSTLNKINNEVGSELDHRRYRMNVIIETEQEIPFEEDSWLGKTLHFGDRESSASIVVVKLDDRCATINMDPETAQFTPQILKTVVAINKNKLGVYCTIVKEGDIKEADIIYLS